MSHALGRFSTIRVLGCSAVKDEGDAEPRLVWGFRAFGVVGFKGNAFL